MTRAYRHSKALKIVPVSGADAPQPEELSPLSREIVIGVVGYAGAGCSTVIKRLRVFLEMADYEVRVVKLSALIAQRFPDRTVTEVLEGLRGGETKFNRACELQDLGDELRDKFEPYAVASLAMAEIIEKDKGRRHGQQVRDAFYLADYFLDNNTLAQDGANLNDDLQRFVDLLLGSALVRPTRGERAMYHAHAAARQSACLSRQVGAAIMAPDGTVVATGANDVPKFGGGVYEEGGEQDHRCHVWEWESGELKFKGCHNNRKKNGLRQEIGTWLAESLAPKLAELAHPPTSLRGDPAAAARAEAQRRIEAFFGNNPAFLEEMPGIKDLIEFSRSIHAEMNALFAAARNGFSPAGATLYCTTYPCHNCARHLVTAGIRQVYHIEPYVKSLATELHEDAITTVAPGPGATVNKMAVVPFTGVGPRMFEDFFTKRTELKGNDGTFAPPDHGAPAYAVRLRELSKVEEKAAALVAEVGDV